LRVPNMRQTTRKNNPSPVSHRLLAKKGAKVETRGVEKEESL